MKEECSGHSDAQPFVGDIACMSVGHEQKEQNEHQDVRYGFYRHTHLVYPFRVTGYGNKMKKKNDLPGNKLCAKGRSGNLFSDLQDR